MRVLSWNIAGNTGMHPDRLDAVCDAVVAYEPDLVTLQEVPSPPDRLKALRQRLKEADLTRGWHFTGPTDGRRSYGNLLATRYPAKRKRSPAMPRGSDDATRELIHRARRAIAHAVVETPRGKVAVFGVHVPNGSGNGWLKVEVLELLAGLVREASARMPVIVAGDFNEPRIVAPNGIVTSAPASAATGRLRPPGQSGARAVGCSRRGVGTTPYARS